MKGIKFYLFILVILAGCRKGDLTPAEYQKWMHNNQDITKTNSAGEFSYTADIVPAQWIAYLNLNGNNNINEYNKKLNETSGMYYFRLTIDIKGQGQNVLKYNISRNEEYFDRLYYVSYQMKNDIKMLKDDKEYPCILYNYERSYDLNSRLSFMLGFEKPAKENEDITLEIKPEGLNGDRIKLKFNSSAFQSIPKLSLQ